MVFEITPDIIEHRKGPSGSGIIVRVPLQTGSRLAAGTPVPAFEQVELTLDPLPNSDSRWIGFHEFQQTRALQSRPPDAIVPFFREWLRRLSAECGFDSWVFRRGMFFDDHIEWWGDRNRRRALHEGIDFAEGRRPGGSVEALAEGVPVRALSDGATVAFLDDFLNKTVVIRHAGIRNEDGDVFHTLLSHIHPEIETAGPVARGQIIGSVAKSRQVGAPAHLHLTGAWIPESIPAEEISMDQINPAFVPIILVNFNSLIRS
jgi:murein DD-endopeptidase MepM/ murein hydrolase activator NlpD